MGRVGVVVRPTDIPSGRYLAVFNPACHLHEDEKRIYLFCRLLSHPSRLNEQGASEIRRIILDLNYKIIAIDEEPALFACDEYDQLGCEDARLSEVDNRHLLTYTAASRNQRRAGNGWRTRIGLAVSDDLCHFQRLGYFLPEEANNKNGVLLPGKVSDQYWLFHRYHPNVWIASSPDLLFWTNIRPVMFVRPGMWDSERIGIGTVLKTEEGWLAFYHGADGNNVYQMGAALFDRDKLWRLLARSQGPLLGPHKDYEREGIVPNVIFPCGGCHINGTFIIFYGAADKVTARAEFSEKEVFRNLKPVKHSPA